MSVGVTGFEPATFCTPCRRASQVTLHPGISWDDERTGRVRRRIQNASMSEVYRFGNADERWPDHPAHRRQTRIANAMGSRAKVSRTRPAGDGSQVGRVE